MKILLLGKDGQVGWELQRALLPLGQLIAAGRQQADFGNPEALRAFVRTQQADVIVNAAAYTAVDKAESEPAAAALINATAVGVLAEEASRTNALLVHYSTDYVFDGSKASPYAESDAVGPLSVYGKTKLEGEQLIRAHCLQRHLIFRTSWVYAARGGNFAKTMLRLARERDQLKVVCDQRGAPTSAELIADTTALAIHALRNRDHDHLCGTYHLAAAGETTWHEYAVFVLQLAKARGAMLKVQPEAVEPIPSTAYPVPAPRPQNSRLDCTRLMTAFGLQMPDWRMHVERLTEELSGKEVL